MSKGYDAFVLQLEEAYLSFPSLGRATENGKEILKGMLSVVDGNGKHWEDYAVEIHSTENFPDGFPSLFETSGKIPKIGDWHIYEDTLACCLKVKPEEIIRCKKGITVTEYIREEVMPYFFNQTHRRVEGYYINGEYGHGLLGVYEFYSDILGTGKDYRATVNLLQFIAMNNQPIRTSLCFCGSQNKFRNCHKKAFEKLKQIGDENLLSDANEFAKATGLV